MLKNYEQLPNGVIHQKKIIKKLPDYNKKYVDERYNSYGEKGMQMAYLRLGYMLGVLGKYGIHSVLDVGYGNGDFLKACLDYNLECYGNDISEYPLPDGVKFVKDIMKKEYDVVCFFDSLEHFENIDFVKNLKAEFVFISLPYCHYQSDEWFKNWKHRRPDEHLWHFNFHSLKEYMQEQGYELERISNFEDTIRKPTNSDINILSGIFKKV